MRDYDITTYGDKAASDYDTLFDGGGSAEPVVTFLSGLVPAGAALELGVGTGRVAIPLARQGLAVTGIDSSPAMLEQLRAKPGGTDVRPILGDFADVAVDCDFDLSYSLCSTFYFLRTQQQQVQCFRNVAARLLPGGYFVLELRTPPYRRLTEHQYVDTFLVDVDEVAFLLSLHNLTAQRVDMQQIMLSEERTRLVPISYRYVWPSELDLMAELAGLSFIARYSDWTGDDFRGVGLHVSVYQKAA